MKKALLHTMLFSSVAVLTGLNVQAQQVNHSLPVYQVPSDSLSANVIQNASQPQVKRIQHPTRMVNSNNQSVGVTSSKAVRLPIGNNPTATPVNTHPNIKGIGLMAPALQQTVEEDIAKNEPTGFKPVVNLVPQINSGLQPVVQQVPTADKKMKLPAYTKDDIFFNNGVFYAKNDHKPLTGVVSEQSKEGKSHDSNKYQKIRLRKKEKRRAHNT